MCGIAGRAGSSPGSRERIESMVASLIHRGPDEKGFYVGNSVELGMRRLSIIDVVAGHQPIHDEKSELFLVFNGEIYNFKTLRTELVKKGHFFLSESDSEVIIHLFEEEGVEAFSRLRGMFAIAIWNINTKELVLARDQIGKKPLMYAISDGNLFFGSETKTVMKGLKDFGKNLSVNFEALNGFLSQGYVASPDNVFNEIKALPPGTFLKWKAGHASTVTYWKPESKVDSTIDYSDALENSELLIRNAVKRRLVSERPLGAFLSGGIDSALITTIMSQESSSKVSTFTIGFDDERFDESTQAREIAHFLGTNHFEFKDSVNPVNLVNDFGQTFDQPFADSSALPTLLLSKRAREEVVVALSGDGGDEVFLGYERYKYLPRLQQANALLKIASPFSMIIEGAADRLGNRKLARLSKEFISYPTLSERYLSGMSLLNFDLRNKYMSRTFKAQVSNSAQPEIRYLQKIAHGETALNARSLSIVDLGEYLPEDLLVKMDLASMRYSLEVRSPLLDLDLIEFALQLPNEVLLRNGKSKNLLKAILGKYMPRNLFDRPKMGFAIPRASWLRNELHEMSHDLLLDSTARTRGWTNTHEVEKLLGIHDGGRDMDAQIWPLICLELWARNWLDS